jgi:flagella basal body P-ring formation protein FlgA
MSASAAAGTFDVSGGTAPWDAPQSMAVRITDSNGSLRDVPLRVQIAQRARVLVLKYGVPRGRVLAADDVTLRPADEDVAGISRIEDIVNKETTRALRAGEPIGPEDVQAIPLVRTGDIVTVVSRRPGVLVRRPMKARSQGAATDTIVLVALDGTTQVTARVTGYHEAEIIGSEVAPEQPGAAAARIQFLE